MCIMHKYRAPVVCLLWVNHKRASQHRQSLGRCTQCARLHVVECCFAVVLLTSHTRLSAPGYQFGLNSGLFSENWQRVQCM